MTNLIVVPRSSSSLLFLRRLLEHLDDVKELKIQVVPTHGMRNISKKKKNIAPFAALSETSLAKEWLSPEDDVWDEWYKTKKK